MARISADRLTVLPVFRRMAEATSSRKTARSFGKRTVIATVGSELTVLRTHLVPRAAPLNAGAEGARQAVDVTARRGSGSARQKSFLLTFFPLGDYLKMTHRTMARRRGRPPGLTEARISNRHILAAAVIAGIKIATVAKQLVVSRSWASREANAQGTARSSRRSWSCIAGASARSLGRSWMRSGTR